MSFYSISKDEINNIFDQFFKNKTVEILDKHKDLHSNKFDKIQLNEIFEEYFKNKAEKEWKMEINLYPFEFTQIFNAYRNGKKEFLEVFEKVHSNAIYTLRKNIKRKTYNIKDMFFQLLDDEKCKDKEIQSIAAKCTLERLYCKIKKETSSILFYSDIFEGMLHSYGNVLFDANSLDGRSYRNNRRMANMDIFPLAKQMTEYNFTYQYPVVESTLFLFRQSIEIHMNRAFGIYKWKNKKKDGTLTTDIGINNLIEYMKEKIDEKKVAIGVDIDVLKLINAWLNKYIHTGVFNYQFWYIDWIQDYLNNFFYERNTLRNLYKSSDFCITKSIYAEISYSNQIQSDLESYKIKTSVQPNRNHEMIVITKEEIIKIQDEVKKITYKDIVI